jgi:hypothetical protein
LVSDGWFSYLLLLRCVPAGICTRIVLGSTIAGTAKIAVWPSDIVHSIGTLCICGTDGAGEDTCCEDEGFHFWLLGLALRLLRPPRLQSLCSRGGTCYFAPNICSSLPSALVRPWAAQLDRPAFLLTWGGPFVFETVQSVAAENCWRRFKKGSRAAMVKIGKHFDGHETAIVEFLAGTKLTSPQSIWTAIAAKLGLGPEVADDCSDAIDAVDIVPEPERRSPTVDPSFYLSNSRDASRDEGPSSEQARARASGPRRKAVAPTIEAPRDPKIPGHRASASTLCSSARARTTSGTCGPRSRTG